VLALGNHLMSSVEGTDQAIAGGALAGGGGAGGPVAKNGEAVSFVSGAAAGGGAGISGARSIGAAFAWMGENEQSPSCWFW